MIARKGLFIVLLIGLLGGYFYIQPYLFGKEEPPTLKDRLPEGDIMGKVILHKVAEESSAMMFYNSFPLRDMIAPDFLLAQAKNYGINIQRNSYFFLNESGEWGALLHITDSSKLYPGVLRLKKNFELKDTLIADQKVYMYPEQDMYLTYGDKWLFVYKGSQFPKRMYHVVYSKKDAISPRWKEFLENKKFKYDKFVLAVNPSKAKRYGLTTALFSHTADSSSVYIKSYIVAKDSLHITMKDSGLAFKTNPGMDKLISVHLNIHKMRGNRQHPLYLWMSRLGKRISFPLDAFFAAWEGDVSFYQGGTVAVKESYVETEMDEDFNTMEVRKFKESLVPGFAVMLSTNERQQDLLAKLMGKGILRREGKRFYLLTSPPLGINTTKTHLYFFATQHTPPREISQGNYGIWNYKGFPLRFELEQIGAKHLEGRIILPTPLLFKQKLLN